MKLTDAPTKNFDLQTHGHIYCEADRAVDRGVGLEAMRGGAIMVFADGSIAFQIGEFILTKPLAIRC